MPSPSRQNKIDEFNRRMTELQQDLEEAVWRLDVMPENWDRHRSS